MGSLHFIGGPSEVAGLIRAKDWSRHEMGVPESWPTELQTVMSLMINAHFPMFLAWGPERFFFYNDAYIPVLGSQKHAAAVGEKFEKIWSEIWSDLLPIIEQVDAGKSSYFENLPLFMNRNGGFEQTYFTFSYSPIKDAADSVLGLFCACVETTSTVLAQKDLIASAEKITAAYKEAEVNAENLKSFFMQSPLPMVILEGDDHRFTLANPPYERFAGQKVIGKTVADVFPADQLDAFVPLLDSVKQTGVPVIGRPWNTPTPNPIKSVLTSCHF